MNVKVAKAEPCPFGYCSHIEYITTNKPEAAMTTISPCLLTVTVCFGKFSLRKGAIYSTGILPKR